MIEVISVANLAGVDWNLFLVLHTVLEERSATKAAKRLHVTQSAVSNALARLRTVFDDPLVVRIGNQLVPTARARELAPRIALVVQQLGEVLNPDHAFDASTSRRRFVVGALADVELVFLPRLGELATMRWPHAALHLVRTTEGDAGPLLASGELDAVVGAVTSVPAECIAEELFEDAMVGLVRPGHPLGALERYGRISTRAEAKERLVVPSCTAAALAVLRSDDVLEVPERLAAFLGATFALQRVALVPARDPISTSLVWHARSDGDSGARALRELVRDAVAPPSG